MFFFSFGSYANDEIKLYLKIEGTNKLKDISFKVLKIAISELTKVPNSHLTIITNRKEIGFSDLGSFNKVYLLKIRFTEKNSSFSISLNLFDEKSKQLVRSVSRKGFNRDKLLRYTSIGINTCVKILLK
jgi:hypothetical protein